MHLRSLTFILGFLMLIPRMDASETSIAPFESAAHQLYLDLQDDFGKNPYFNNVSMNSLRDGIVSPFMALLYPQIEANNARALTERQLSFLPEFRMISESVFRRGLIGHQNLLASGRVKTSELLTIVDFSLPTKERRLFVFDLKQRRVLFNTHVAHGINSDRNKDGIPESFSNTAGSLQSSLGFFVTDQTAGRTPTWRYGLRVEGVDGSLNSQARSRTIIFHDFAPMAPNSVSNPGMLPVTEGCFGLSGYDSGRFYGMEDAPLNDLVLNSIAGGTVVYADSPTVDLEKTSLHIDLEKAAASYEKRGSFTLH